MNHYKYLYLFFYYFNNLAARFIQVSGSYVIQFHDTMEQIGAKGFLLMDANR